MVRAPTASTDGEHIRPTFRLHSQCMTGDLFGSNRCDCGDQLTRSFDVIGEFESGGAIIYMTGDEGRGIGLVAKVKAYRAMQEDNKLDTYAANELLGFPADMRSYETPAAILASIFEDVFHSRGARSVRLLSGNPKKAEAVVDALVNLASSVDVEYLDIAPSSNNHSYLAVKSKWASGEWQNLSHGGRTLESVTTRTEVIVPKNSDRTSNVEMASETTTTQVLKEYEE